MEEHEEEPRDYIEDVRERHGIYTRANVGEAGGVAVYPVTAVGALLDEHDRLRARVADLEAELTTERTMAWHSLSSRRAAWRYEGASAMRERAAAECEVRARYVQDADMTLAYELRTVAGEIRTLPLDTAAPPASDLVAYIRSHREWSESTLGPGERTEGILAHIRKELDEIAADPRDIEEWADVIILAIDGAWRSGASAEDLAEALAAKQAKNRARQWPDWREVPADKPIEHVREGSDA